MAQHRITWTFSPAVGGPIQSNSGWSESYYISSDYTTAQALSIAVGTDFGQLLPARLALLTTGWRIDGARVVQWPSARLGDGAGIPPATGRGEYVLAGSTTNEQPYDKLVVRYNSLAGRWRMAFLGGIGSNVVDPGGNFLNPAAWATAWTSWLTSLTLYNAAVLVRTPSIESVITVVSVSSADGLPSVRTPRLVVPGDSTAEYTRGRLIRISGAQGVAGLNGVWTVYQSTLSGATTLIDLRAKRGTQIIGTYQNGGRVVGYSGVLSNIVTGTERFGRSRKTGRPSGSPRGRRRSASV